MQSSKLQNAQVDVQLQLQIPDNHPEHSAGKHYSIASST